MPDPSQWKSALPRERKSVPLAPPEDILSWLGRIGLLEEEEAEEEEEISSRGDSLLDDEFDLDDDSQLLGDVAQEAGIESENSLE